jgi:hypothetical protein
MINANSRCCYGVLINPVINGEYQSLQAYHGRLPLQANGRRQRGDNPQQYDNLTQFQIVQCFRKLIHQIYLNCSKRPGG